MMLMLLNAEKIILPRSYLFSSVLMLFNIFLFHTSLSFVLHLNMGSEGFVINAHTIHFLTR